MQGLRFLAQPLLGLLIFAAALAAGPRAAHAAGPLDKREIEARADFAAGRYQKAVDTFAQLYADTADPVYLRNIGRCYQKMKRPHEAIDSFQEYLHKAKSLSKAERKEVEGYIDEMKTLQAAETPAAPPAAPPAPPTPTAPAAPAAAAATSTAVATTAPSSAAAAPAAILLAPPPPATPPPSSDGGKTWRIAGIAAAAGGAACIAAGIAFGAAASADADAVAKKYDASTDSAGKRDVTLQWVGYGVGAAALVSGALLYMHGMQPPAESHAGLSDLRAVAAVDRGGAGLRLEGAF